MLLSKETFIHDAEVEIVVPNDMLDCNEENVDDIFDAEERTQIYYDELLHFYLIITLPPESNLGNKEEATEFFKKLEVTFEATLIDTLNLTVPNYSSQLIHRTPSSSSASSLLSNRSSNYSDTSSTITSPSIPGTPNSDYSFKRHSSSKLTEGTVIHSAQYCSKKNNNHQMVVVERDDCWICVLPLSFPVANERARAQCQIGLNITVTQTQRKRRSPNPDLYSLENFGMNLLAGLNDDPAFESLNTSCSISTSRLPKKDVSKRSSIYSSLPSAPIKRCSRKTFPIKSTLNVNIRTVNVSPLENSLMMSVDLENDTENNIAFSVESVKIEVDHSFVTRYSWDPQDTSNNKFPVLLRSMDQVTFLYNVTILEDPSFPIPSNNIQYYPTHSTHSKTSSKRESVATINSILNAIPDENVHRALSITVRGCPVIAGVKSRCIESKWDCKLDVSNLLKDQVIGRKHMPMICDDKFNHYGINKARDSFSVNNGLNVKNHDIGYEYNSGLEINVNGINIANTKYDGESNVNLLNINYENNGILPSGRLPKLPKQADVDVNDGVVVTFEVCGKAVVGKVFTMKVFIVNKSKHIRRFTIMIPNKKRPDERLIKSQTPRALLSQSTLVESDNENVILPLEDPFMDETEMLRKHLEFETPDAGLICLDNDVRVGPLNPYQCEYATLHFISTKAALHSVELAQLIDDDTGYIMNFKNAVQVNVEPCNAKNKKRIDRNSFVLRHIEVTG